MTAIGITSTNYSAHDTNEIPRNDGFIPNASGVLVGQLRQDSANRNHPVVAGVYYDLDIKLFHTTSTGVSQITVYATEQRGR